MPAKDDEQPLLHKRHKNDGTPAAAIKNGMAQYGTTKNDKKPSTDDDEHTPKSVSIAQLVSG
jgi:hypothetical protein